MLNINNTDISRLFFDGVEIENAYLNGGIIYSKVGAFEATYQIDDFNDPLTLPVSKDYLIDWGDGVQTTVGNIHFYTSNGIKTVKMYGVVDDFFFNNSGDKDKILTVENGGGLLISRYNFLGCSNLSAINDRLNVLDTEFQLRETFSYCPNLVTVDVDLTNSNITYLWFTFRGSDNIQNVNTLDTSNIDIFYSPFNICDNFNGSLSNWDTSSATSFFNFFRNCFAFNQDVSHFVTDKVENMQEVFAFATSFNHDVSGWDFRSVITLNNFMQVKSSANYDYQYYDNLLIKWDSDPSVGGLDFGKLINFTTDFGTIQYSTKGIAARDSL